MVSLNAKLPPKVHKRLDEESSGEDAEFDTISEAGRYYLLLGMFREGELQEEVNELRERNEELRDERDSWREDAESWREVAMERED